MHWHDMWKIFTPNCCMSNRELVFKFFECTYLNVARQCLRICYAIISASKHKEKLKRSHVEHFEKDWKSKTSQMVHGNLNLKTISNSTGAYTKALEIAVSLPFTEQSNSNFLQQFCFTIKLIHMSTYLMTEIQALSAYEEWEAFCLLKVHL